MSLYFAHNFTEHRPRLLPSGSETKNIYKKPYFLLQVMQESVLSQVRIPYQDAHCIWTCNEIEGSYDYHP